MIRREVATKKVKKNRADDDVSDEVSSFEQHGSSSSSAPKNADGEEMTYEDLQDQMVEQLSEKRASTRMSALSRLIEQLSLSVQYDFVSDRLDTLSMYILGSIRKGDAAEVTLASRALMLLAVTLGADGEKLVSDSTPVLHEYLKNASKSPNGRAAVAQALGFINFIASPNDHDTLAAMTMLLDQLRLVSTPEALATSAWEAWGLLASTLPTHKLAGDIRDAHLAHLIAYLDHEAIDVKTAAGECIALIWEAKQTIDAGKPEQEEEEEAEDEATHAAGSDDLEDLSLGEAAVPTEVAASSTAMTDVEPAFQLSGDFALSASTRSPALHARKRPHVKGLSSRATASSSGKASSLAIDEAGLIARFNVLAKDSSRHQSKKARAVQKKSFREFLRTLESGEGPSESLKIEKSRHEFEGWVQLVQLDAVRDVVGAGLNTHLVHNETLQQVFDLYIESGDGVDDPRRKAAARANSKIKARENAESREKNRKKKHQMANSFGHDE